MDVRRSLVDSKTKKFRYFHKNTKKAIKSKSTLLRIKTLRIPPDYRKVRISNSARSKVQAVGEDNKGRKQYIYHRDFIEEQQEIKFLQILMIMPLDFLSVKDFKFLKL